MKTLVTGATGFIGSELTRQLLQEGVRVRILRRATSRLDLLGEAAQHVEHVLGDVTDPPSLCEAMADVGQVYHVAAYVGLGGRRDHARLHRVNVGGTAHVVNAALEAGVERLVHTSSIAALGRPERPIDETTEWHASSANTAYAVSKHEAELEVYRGIAEGLDAVIVNPSLVFGVGRPGENTRLIAERIRDGKIPATPGGGTNVVDVEDVAAGHRQAMRHGKTGERYLLGGENISWKTIFGTLAEALGVAPPRRARGKRAVIPAPLPRSFAREKEPGKSLPRC
ncbi:MAG: SDR family NAD(P)-dependent oxidoreductase [Bacteroidetes bacterium]|nr:SDR family NAD(P)-dependent oxidoreductase [Bacteroidota bacterium]